jgi:hypothetical protein
MIRRCTLARCPAGYGIQILSCCFGIKAREFTPTVSLFSSPAKYYVEHSIFLC